MHCMYSVDSSSLHGGDWYMRRLLIKINPNHTSQKFLIGGHLVTVTFSPSNSTKSKLNTDHKKDNNNDLKNNNTTKKMSDIHADLYRKVMGKSDNNDNDNGEREISTDSGNSDEEMDHLPSHLNFNSITSPESVADKIWSSKIGLPDVFLSQYDVLRQQSTSDISYDIKINVERESTLGPCGPRNIMLDRWISKRTNQSIEGEFFKTILDSAYASETEFFYRVEIPSATGPRKQEYYTNTTFDIKPQQNLFIPITILALPTGKSLRYG